MFEDVAEYVSNNLEIQLGIIKIVYIIEDSWFIKFWKSYKLL